MTSPVEHPDIQYVIAPRHLDGTPAGTKPRMRHHADCSHFDMRGGVRLGSPVLATDEQMRTLRACKTCIARQR